MNPQAPEMDPERIGADQIPSIEVLVTDLIARFSLAAHAYLMAEEGKQPDVSSAEMAIDVASAAFERIKERLGPEERLAITQLLTETRMTFVKKRGL